MRHQCRDVRRVGARPVTGLRGAVTFLTRVPIGYAAVEIDLARSVPFVPVVGALVGLAVAGADIGVGAVLPRLPAAALAVTVGVVLTGALHEDGLADTADALGARDRADVLRILRDPAHGTYGVLALVPRRGPHASTKRRPRRRCPRCSRLTHRQAVAPRHRRLRSRGNAASGRQRSRPWTEQLRSRCFPSRTR